LAIEKVERIGMDKAKDVQTGRVRIEAMIIGNSYQALDCGQRIFGLALSGADAIP
jgi:hypothetical protein